MIEYVDSEYNGKERELMITIAVAYGIGIPGIPVSLTHFHKGEVFS